MACDNLSNVHDPEIVAEDNCAVRVVCKICKHQITIRKDPFTGAPEKRKWAEVFKRDTLQPNSNLFYKVYPQHIRT